MISRLMVNWGAEYLRPPQRREARRMLTSELSAKALMAFSRAGKLMVPIYYNQGQYWFINTTAESAT